MNEALSKSAGRPIVESEDIMSRHLADYMSLSFRVDRRYYFQKSNLVVFAGAWNLFDHQNELFRFWDIYGNSYLSSYMWGTVPFIGLEFEF